MNSASADADSSVVTGRVCSSPIHNIHLLCCMLVLSIAAFRLFVVQGHLVKAITIAFLLLLVWRHFYSSQYLEKFSVILPALLLGIASPLLPGFAPGALLLLAICYCIFLIPKLPREIISWASWPIALLFIYVMVAIIQGFDPEIIKILYLGIDGPGDKGFRNIVQFLTVSPPSYLTLIEAVSRYYVFFLIFSWFSYQVSERGAFLKGILLCFPFAATAALLSYLGYLSTNFLSQSDYWNAQNRFSGTFSDPNAFGVFSAFILPLVVSVIQSHKGWKRISLGLLYIVSLSMAMLSGSRSFILGILIFVFFMMLLKNKRATVVSLFFGLVLIFVWNMWLWLAPGSSTVFETSLPVALRRLFETISVDQIEQALFSRALFYETALRMWNSSPVLGVGFNAFRDYVPIFTLMSGSDIGMWIDNANNWYLQILAEMGIIGAIAFVYAALQLKIEGVDKTVQIFVPLFVI
ncbi:MAG: O-antigen ligase family protein, partial [SAR324 cluster bacterium]|nr:O-antigen ligase family protein [SAR324 cluster bacterium]